MYPESRQYAEPEVCLPQFQPSLNDCTFLQQLGRGLRATIKHGEVPTDIDQLFLLTSFPQRYERLILILYAPGHKRILVSRGEQDRQLRFSEVWQRLVTHARCQLLAAEPFRLQMDFVVEPPMPVDFYAVGMEIFGERHFEIGVDGLLFRGPDRKQQVFPPGDAYVRSVMGMGQLRDYLKRAYGDSTLREAQFERFRSLSYLSAQDTWLRLYRGHPLVGALTKDKIEHAVALAVGHIRQTQEENGKFLYYYDAGTNSRWDHEHLTRDPIKHPYYNILRHGGGGLTCVFHEKYAHLGDTITIIRRAIDYLITCMQVQDYHGREGAYIYSERKAKLGGSGVALYLMAEYQLLTGDRRYQGWAERIAWHLVNQVTETGEFIYYNIYLDKPVTVEENQQYFSFYYPGEAVCGLAKYLHLVEKGARGDVFAKLRKALEFLLVVRPATRASEYTVVPSDSWLMMGIKELWDFEEMRAPHYAQFVFADAQAMIDHMYKVTDAPYPDYAGAFYYSYGDYPYADGARCEGLLGAYELACAMGEQERAAYLWRAIKLAAWALMHLVNTEDSLYFAPNPTLSLGGIRFKYTRQWFRIDTIQHVASFFAKMLPHWDRAEENHCR